jgi:hypothetical protein
MKKFTDKILHHHHEGEGERLENAEDREHELDRSKDRHLHKESHVSFAERPFVASSTSMTSTTGDIRKQHTFNDDISKQHTFTDDIPKQHTFTERLHEKNLPTQSVGTVGTAAHTDVQLHEHVHEHINPPIVDTIVRDTIVEETVRRDKVVEIQPIIHRRVDVPEVHHVEKHVYEKVAPVAPSRIVKQPVVEETIQPHITEDITTVLHREVPAPYVVHEERHITEHQVKPTLHTTEILEDKKPTIITNKDVRLEEVHTSDWEEQTIDRCPLAMQEHLAGGVLEGKTVTSTTTTTATHEEPFIPTNTSFVPTNTSFVPNTSFAGTRSDAHSLEHNFGKVSLSKDMRSDILQSTK